MRHRRSSRAGRERSKGTCRRVAGSLAEEDACADAAEDGAEEGRHAVGDAAPVLVNVDGDVPGRGAAQE